MGVRNSEGEGVPYTSQDKGVSTSAVCTSVDPKRLPSLSANASEFIPTNSNHKVGSFGGGGTPSRGAMGETLSQQDTGGGGAMEPVSTLAAAPLSALSAALLAQQLPNIPNFNGENLEGDGESFGDWLERLELVACACRWDDQAKLVNFATRLRGTASRFYRTCTPKQKSSYQDLVKAFRSRFTQCSFNRFTVAHSTNVSSVLMRLLTTTLKSCANCLAMHTQQRVVVKKQRPWGSQSSLTSLYLDW